TSVLRLVSLPEFLEADQLAVAKARGQHTADIRRHDAYRRARLVNRFHFYLHLTHDDGSAYTASEALEAALRDNKTPADDVPDADEASMKSLLDMECPSLPAIVERIIHAFVPPALKASENLFLSTYQDAVIEFTKRGNHDIRSFLDWWDKGGHRTAINLPADINAVTVMTIHKAKGLEFPCVHIPFAGGDMFKAESVDWVDFDTSRFAAIGIDESIVPPAMPLAITKAMTESDLYGRSCADIVAQTNIDELNVNYVAFTRPTRELIVNCSAPKEGTFSKLVDNAFKTLDDARLDTLGIADKSRRWVMPLVGRYADNILTIGEPTTPVKAKGSKASRPTLELKRYTTAPDMKRMTARTQPDAIEPFDPDSLRHLGNFLHAVMSLVMTPGDLDSAMKRQIYRYRMREPLASQLRQRLQSALANPEAARWFDGFTRVITERPISNDGRDTRIDRVVWLPDGTVEVVDYKFVDKLPDTLDDSDTHRKYTRQVRGYCNSIHGNTGATVRGYIWYISPDNNIIVKI
ncbi:MAG: PD-(D/E)XK nuclease family protein, partial [Muribaculaceae bacterium]|nr:PD-(D/E)XK nuclease family protein [Muribaculaceae bacterium]